MTDSRDELMAKIAAESGKAGDYTYEEKLAARRK
jgi:hypothetical protein